MTPRTCEHGAQRVELARYRSNQLDRGASRVAEALWMTCQCLVRSALPGSWFRIALLRLFGAQIGTNVIIRPGVRVKFPWRLSMGDYTWVGEDTWFDNLAPVTLGTNVCVSQGAYFCTGNHDWSDPTFGLLTKGISVGDGAWIGAKAVLAPGTTVGEMAIVGLGSVASGVIPPFEIHLGNPAQFVRRRVIRSAR